MDVEGINWRAFVGRNLECKLYTFFRSNQEQLRKMQEQGLCMAGITPVHGLANSAKQSNQLRYKGYLYGRK